ncbi:hypothetical protein [Sorangium sp. So ce128]|uniref:hypothetical protein n=1 Tax=Sorangium sp. So ce128 TaxID=3133281 RepID=UPI003F604BD2
MKRTVHGVAGTLALCLVSTFFLSTMLAELSGNVETIVTVKRGILYGLALLIPSIAAAGGSGNFLARSRRGRIVDGKQRRMKFIAMNGLLVLVPCAFVLYRLASRGNFGPLFVGLQAAELMAGATNIYLLSKMMRDGFRLSGRLAPARASSRES